MTYYKELYEKFQCSHKRVCKSIDFKRLVLDRLPIVISDEYVQALAAEHGFKSHWMHSKAKKNSRASMESHDVGAMLAGHMRRPNPLDVGASSLGPNPTPHQVHMNAVGMAGMSADAAAVAAPGTPAVPPATPAVTPVPSTPMAPAALMFTPAGAAPGPTPAPTPAPSPAPVEDMVAELDALMEIPPPPPADGSRAAPAPVPATASQDICVFCQQNMDPVADPSRYTTRSGCGHVYHTQCYLTWLQVAGVEADACPMRCHLAVSNPNGSANDASAPPAGGPSSEAPVPDDFI